MKYGYCCVIKCRRLVWYHKTALLTSWDIWWNQTRLFCVIYADAHFEPIALCIPWRSSTWQNHGVIGLLWLWGRLWKQNWAWQPKKCAFLHCIYARGEGGLKRGWNQCIEKYQQGKNSHPFKMCTLHYFYFTNLTFLESVNQNILCR